MNPKPKHDPEVFKAVARFKKAKKLRDVILEAGGGMECVDLPQIRSMVTKISGVHVPSEATWAVVREMLRDAEAA